MAEDRTELEDLVEELEPDTPRRRRVWRKVLGGLLALSIAVVLFAWFSRERIAEGFIAGELEKLGLPATYKVERIGPGRQVLGNIVIGDPARPDLTVKRAEVAVKLRWGTPSIGRITLVEPRLYGTWRGGKPSFGSLDKVLFTGSKEPFRLPDLDLAIVDGRSLIESDHGPVGVKLEGSGYLRDGFSGVVAAVAPGFATGGCKVGRATVFAAVAVAAERPSLKGPLRLRDLACPGREARLARADIALDATFDRALDGADARLGLSARGMSFADARIAQSDGTARLAWRKGALTAHYDLTGKRVAAGGIGAGTAMIDGAVRTGEGFARVEGDGTISATDLDLGSGADRQLAALRQAGAGTLLAPLVERLRGALRRESRGSALGANYALRIDGGAMTVLVPQATLRGGSGAALLALSRFELSSIGAERRLAGNFVTGGRDMPRLAGRMERNPGGDAVLRLRMQDYAAGSARLAIPELLVAQGPRGALGFAGRAVLSGPLPGGSAQGLALPIDGNWSPAGGLALWRRCIDVRFDRLELANLQLERRSVPVCPARGGAIVRQGGSGGLRIAAGVPSLDVAGRLGATPIRIRSGPVGFAMPGVLNARAVDVALGPAANASRFTIARLDARIGKDIAGSFGGSAIRLGAVPLDLLETQGQWRYAGGRLAISGASFRLEDRQEEDRFQPLLASGGTLTLVNNRILANALLREPANGREVVRTVIRHDLATGRGDADLFVDGIVFDEELQPDMLTRNALGVVANVAGTVTGRGHIDWTGPQVTSTGLFRTDSLDFAAAFGPVKGASGTLEFTDLLGLVSAPGQELRIASINPGIEVFDGVLRYRLLSESRLALEGGTWPFLGGTLQLQPTGMQFGVAETRRFALTIHGLEAAKLVERLDMANLSANGTFDGIIPLVFDEDGGRIDGGLLQSRAPGGNISYVGELTYKDLSAMANFAFDALRSLDYSFMRVHLDGALDGEIVTRMKFDGIKQGAGTSRNFITRQIAKLPIQFNVNVRAPFFSVISSLRSMYDPAYVRDPRSLGLVDDQGRRIAPVPVTGPPAGPIAPVIDPPAIQPLESGSVP